MLGCLLICLLQVTSLGADQQLGGIDIDQRLESRSYATEVVLDALNKPFRQALSYLFVRYAYGQRRIRQLSLRNEAY